MWVLVVAAASAYLTKCWQKASKKQCKVQKISDIQSHSSGESSDSTTQVDKGGLSRIFSKSRDTKEFSHKYAKSGEKGLERGSLLVKEKSGVQRLRGFGSWKRKGLLCREASVVVNVISRQKSSSNLSSSASSKSPKTIKSSSNICSDCDTVVLATKRQDFPVQSPSESIVPKKKELSVPLNLNYDLGHCTSPSECFSSQLQTRGKQIFVFHTQPAHKVPEVRKRKGRANDKTRQRQPKSCHNISINVPEGERGKVHCLTDLSEQGMSCQKFNLVPLLNKKRKLADYAHLPFRKGDANNALENSKETSRELVMFLAGLQLGLFCSFISRDLKQHSHHHVENMMTSEKQSCISVEGGYGATSKCICEEVDDNESVKSVVTVEAVSNHRMSDLEAELVAEFERMRHNFNPEKHPQPYSSLGDLEDPDDVINIFPDETCRSRKSNKSDPAYEKIHTGISPSELEKRLHMVLVERYEATIAELEACIQVAESQLLAKERELQVWKDHVYQLTNSSLSACLGNKNKIVQGTAWDPRHRNHLNFQSCIQVDCFDEGHHQYESNKFNLSHPAMHRTMVPKQESKVPSEGESNEKKNSFSSWEMDVEELHNVDVKPFVTPTEQDLNFDEKLLCCDWEASVLQHTIYSDLDKSRNYASCAGKNTTRSPTQGTRSWDYKYETEKYVTYPLESWCEMAESGISCEQSDDDQSVNLPIDSPCIVQIK